MWGATLFPLRTLDAAGYVAAQATLDQCEIDGNFGDHGRVQRSCELLGLAYVSGGHGDGVKHWNIHLDACQRWRDIGKRTRAVCSLRTPSQSMALAFSGTITLMVSGVSPNNLSDTPACSFGTTGTITLNASATPPTESGSGTLTCTTTAAGSVFVRLIRPLSRPWNLSAFATP